MVSRTEVKFISFEAYNKPMRIVQINSSSGGSPGMLMHAISARLKEEGIENYNLFTAGTSSFSNDICYSDPIRIKLNALRSRVTGNYGFVSRDSTKKLLSLLDHMKPDLIQLHVIHGHDFNLESFFQYVKDRNIPVVYTFHDCWAFTGDCPHYSMIHCDQWKTCCEHCPLYKRYSWFHDHSSSNYLRKNPPYPLWII